MDRQLQKLFAWFSLWTPKESGFQDLSRSAYLGSSISASSLIFDSLLLQLYPLDPLSQDTEPSDTGTMASQTKRALYEPAPVHNKLQSNYEYISSKPLLKSREANPFQRRLCDRFPLRDYWYVTLIPLLGTETRSVSQLDIDSCTWTVHME